MLIHVDYSQYRHRSVGIVLIHCSTMEIRTFYCYYSSVHCFFQFQNWCARVYD